MTNADEQIGRNVTEYRDRGGMSQKDLADRMRTQGWKWSQATVWSVEKGERPLRLAEADDLAAILSTTTSHLTWPDGATQTQSAMHRVREAHEALKKAIAEYKWRQMELAIVADDAGVYNTGFRDMVEDWITTSPTDVVRSVAKDEEAEYVKERFLSRDIISDEREAELSHAAQADNGPFMKLLSTQLESDGIDTEAP